MPRSLLLAEGGDLFVAQRLYECRMPEGPSILRLDVEGTTAEYGQKLIFGLLDLKDLEQGRRCAGIAVSIDPETGIVCDLHNEAGVIGYVGSLPMEPGGPVSLGIEAWVYGRTVIPRLHVGEEIIVHPALLMESGREMIALAGGEISNGVIPSFGKADLVLEAVDGRMPIHG